MGDLKAAEYKRFEDIKIIRADGSEYWPARDLAPALDYAKWENFSKVIDRAMLACRNSGFEISNHFPDVQKMVEMPSKPRKNESEIGFPDVRKTKNIIDYELTRYACYSISMFDLPSASRNDERSNGVLAKSEGLCQTKMLYLIVQNGDPRKEVIALGQTYFAIQTYRQEIADRFNRLDEDNKRLVI